jgi:type IV pilus assembly protein PilE
MLRTSRGRAAAAGFTLIELMIVVVIMAILAAIVVPTYTSFVQRSKIVEGTTRLGDFRTQMERYFMDNRTYLNGAACGIPDPPVAGNDSFQFTCVAAAGPPETYTVTAAGRAARGMAGFTYRINQANAKSSAGPGGKFTNGTCWALYPDGSC